MTQLGLFLARRSPRWVSYGLARIAANIIARQKPGLGRDDGMMDRLMVDIAGFCFRNEGFFL